MYDNNNKPRLLTFETKLALEYLIEDNNQTYLVPLTSLQATKETVTLKALNLKEILKKKTLVLTLMGLKLVFWNINLKPLPCHDIH